MDTVLDAGRPDGWHPNCEIHTETATRPTYNGTITVTAYCEHGRIVSITTDSIL